VLTLALGTGGVLTTTAPASATSSSTTGGDTLAAPPARLAPTTFQEVHVNFHPNSAGTAGGYVSCPPGTKVVTVGATAASPSGGRLTALTPTFDGNGGYASAVFSPSLASRSVLDVEAICTPPEQLSSVATLASTVPPSSWGFLDIRACPTGKAPFDGGAFFTQNGVIRPDIGVSFTALTPSGNGWFAVATPRDPVLAMQSYMRCIDPLQLGPGVTATASAPVSGTGLLQPTTVTAFCPAGYRAYAGGAVFPDAHGILRTSHVSFNRTAWTVQGFGSPGSSLHVEVRCIRTDQR
jgi:hypothetical protein